jgi:hypothetical protein
MVTFDNRLPQLNITFALSGTDKFFVTILLQKGIRKEVNTNFLWVLLMKRSCERLCYKWGDNTKMDVKIICDIKTNWFK